MGATVGLFKQTGPRISTWSSTLGSKSTIIAVERGFNRRRHLPAAVRRCRPGRVRVSAFDDRLWSIWGGQSGDRDSRRWHRRNSNPTTRKWRQNRQKKTCKPRCDHRMLEMMRKGEVKRNETNLIHEPYNLIWEIWFRKIQSWKQI